MHADRPITDLTSTDSGKPELTPETPVLVLNRGVQTLVRKFDNREYPLHSHTQGYIRMPYGAALHFQRHCPVQGTRDVESGLEASYLAIVRTDDPRWAEQLYLDSPDSCEPFTPEQCAEFGQRVEAVYRDPGEEVVTVPVNQAIASGKVPVRGQSRRKPGFDPKGRTASGKAVDINEMRADDESAADRISAIEAEEAEA